MQYNIGDRVRVISKDDCFIDEYMGEYTIEAIEYGGILLPYDRTGDSCFEVTEDDIELVNR